MDRYFWSRPSDEALASVGLRSSDHPPPPDVPLWPDVLPAIHLFLDLDTQWRMGPGGPVGLDYSVFFHELDRKGLDREVYDEVMSDLRVIEQAALANIHK